MKVVLNYGQTIALGDNNFIKPSVSGEFNIPDTLIEEGASEEIVRIHKTYENILVQIYKRARDKNKELVTERIDLTGII